VGQAQTMHAWNSRCSGCPDEYTNLDCGCQIIESETCNPYGSTLAQKYCELHNPDTPPLQKEHLLRELIKQQIADFEESKLKSREFWQRQREDDAKLEKLRQENNALEQLLKQMKDEINALKLSNK
jgi:hypothetical protein